MVLIHQLLALFRRNVINIAYHGIKLCGVSRADNGPMLSRPRKDEIVNLFQRKLQKGSGTTQEIRKLSRDELEQTLVRLSYRDENAGLHLAVNDEIYQRKVEQQQRWLVVIIIMFVGSLTVLFGGEFLPLFDLAY